MPPRLLSPIALPSPGTEPARQPALPVFVWGLFLLALTIRIAVAAATRFTSEDFLITLRYAENLAGGAGFVYNAGEQVLGTTTPLYALFLAACTAVGLPAAAVGKGLNILADSAGVLLAYRILRLCGQPGAGLTAAWLLAVNPLQVRWAISGMETGLVVFLGLLAWYLWLARGDFPGPAGAYLGTYLVLGALFLTRWDSLLLLAAVTAAVLWRERRGPWGGLALWLLVVAPWLLFAAWYFGSPIPGTAAAKLTVYNHPGSQLFPMSPPLLQRFVGGPEYFVPLLLAVLGAGVAVRRRLWLLAPPVAWMLLYGIVLAISPVPVFEWYLLPPGVIYMLLMALGLSALQARLGRRPHPALAAAAALVLAIPAAGWAVHVCRGTQSVEAHLRRPLGEWLGSVAEPGDTVLLEPIGYIGYYSRLRVLDAVGLVSPQVLDAWRSEEAVPLLTLRERYRPEWCVWRPAEAAAIDAAARAAGLNDPYELRRTFSYSRPTDGRTFTFLVYRRTAREAAGEPSEAD
jgi:hypothetical protein